MKNVFPTILLFLLAVAIIDSSSCVPPPAEEEKEGITAEQARLDSLQKIKCPRLLSSAAEYYKNKDWVNTVRIYKEVVDLGCDRGQEEEVYQYWAIGYEYLGKFDSAEYALLQGLKRLPENLNLHQRLAYAYKRLGNVDKEIQEYERIIDLIPEDTEPLKRLSELYANVERYEEQIYILKKILELEPSNLDAQGDLARAYKKVGKDPLDIYRQIFADNPDNISFGLDLCDQLIAAGEYEEAISILSRLANMTSRNSAISIQLVLKKLAQAYYKNDQIEESLKAYERLFEHDPRDFRTALEIVKLNVDINRFSTAIKWANKAIRLAPENGETYGTKGFVYFKAFQECRKDYPSTDDKIVATLAFKYYQKAEENNYKLMQRNKNWLEDNEVLFGKSDWFMLDDEKKVGGKVFPSGDCYSWIKESISKQPDW